MLRGRPYLLALALLLAHVVPACLEGGESRTTMLNPQPLPPADDGEDFDDKNSRATGGSAAPETADGSAGPTDGGTDARDAGLE